MERGSEKIMGCPSRRIGGLETNDPGGPTKYGPSRRIGGLEIRGAGQTPTRDPSRRIGGLET